jgi:hypothetical protein
MPSRFQVLVPCPYGFRPDISGPIVAAPGITAFGTDVRCVRWHLPKSIGRLLHIFPKKPPGSAGDVVRNFFHMDDYFVVDDSLKDFFVEQLSTDVEVAAIDMRHHDGRPAGEPYFAVKVVRTIECVASDRSLAVYKGELFPFAQRVANFELAKELAAEFANAGDSRYVAYPHFGISRELHLNEERIPPGTSLFQPTYWPGALIVTPEFAKQLGERCDGGGGYDFWTLDQGNVGKAYFDLSWALR